MTRGDGPVRRTVVREHGRMRLGYDPGFLSIELPLPDPRREVATLDYPRFTVLLDRARRLAAVTGVTIDGRSILDLPRRGEWRLDPRLPADAQTGPEVYARNDLDRGHLVRRRDPGWGTETEAREATAATFVYPNAAPQAADFNQSKLLWLGLEDHVLAYADAEDVRIAVFTAPVLDPADPPYRGIRVPLRFWKVAAWVDPARGLASAGFVLDQTSLVDTTEGLVEVPPLAPFRTFQVPVATVAEIAGVDLGPLVAADVRPVESVIGATAWQELSSAGGIRLHGD